VRVRRGALVALIGTGLISGAGPASADVNLARALACAQE